MTATTWTCPACSGRAGPCWDCRRDARGDALVPAHGAGVHPVDAVHNDAVTEWVADYDAWLSQGLNCVTTTEGLSPAEWDRWRAAYDAKGAVLLGQARALFGAELGERA